MSNETGNGVPAAMDLRNHLGAESRRWTATMIASDSAFGGAALLRVQRALDSSHGAVVSAALHATALGVFQAYIGTHLVSDEVLSPGWSAYEWRLRYRSYDVTDAVQVAGADVIIGLALGNGWAAGRLGWNNGSHFYADEPSALAELEIHFEDGHRQIIVTDDTWLAGPSAVLANDLYDGEVIDARRYCDAWLASNPKLQDWCPVHAIDFDAARLVPYTSPVVRRQETLPARRIWTSPKGKLLVDFGQNLVGWVRLTAQGASGERITVRHAEVLEHEELGIRPIRTAAATDTFICSGGTDVFEPTLTSHGFRYVQVDGYPGELALDAIQAVVVHTDVERIGYFACSSDDINQLHHNVVWGLKGNFLDLPTDCPQRDERLGWTGDLAVVAPTAAFLFDVREFLADWMEDLAVEQQHANGRVPYVIPDLLKLDEVPEEFRPVESAAIWSDVAVWLPWALWEAYGDQALLARHLEPMLAHCRHVEGLLSPSGLWDAGFQFGDWLDPDAPPDNAAAAKADKGVVATASIFRSLVMTAKAARIVGRDTDADEMDALAIRVLTAFQSHYVYGGGRIVSDCQTVYALAIKFGLLVGNQQAVAGKRLAELVEASDYKISTGFAGTPYVLHALSATGHSDVAYRMLHQPEVPGWMFQVRMGATTMWERWDSMLPDGSINPGAMTSFNHYAFGSVADWLHRVVLGITPVSPGYNEILIAPTPGGGLTWAEGSLKTKHGTVFTRWEQTPDRFHVVVEVPGGVAATLQLPNGDTEIVPAGRHEFSTAL